MCIYIRIVRARRQQATETERGVYLHKGTEGVYVCVYIYVYMYEVFLFGDERIGVMHIGFDDDYNVDERLRDDDSGKLIRRTKAEKEKEEERKKARASKRGRKYRSVRMKKEGHVYIRSPCI